jgi:hypothetical protein
VAKERADGHAAGGRPRRSLGDMRWNRFLVIALSLLATLAFAGVAIALLGVGAEPQNTSANPAPAAPPITPAPAEPTVPDEPVPASSSAALSPTADPTVVSAFAGEAEKIRNELREHDVPFTETDVAAILAIGEEAVARNVPDLRADDPLITERVAQAFPRYTRQQQKVVVRCVAEQVEQVIARRSGDGTPPDQGGRPGG